MENQPIVKNPVLIQLQTGLYLGLVCYNPLYENLKFVLEKREFFEMEWPAIMISQEKGFFPVLLGLPYITIQRSQILWYTTHIPAEILTQYQAYLPFVGGKEAVPSPMSSKPAKSTSSSSHKIIPFPSKKKEEKDAS
ncbi:MAG: hypothetical protein ACK4K4_03350 [Caldimicrobium sp.]